jgi:hypothetical protein
MYSARGSVPAVALLSVSALCSFPAFSQSTQFLNLEARSLRLTSLSSSANACSMSNSNPSLAALPSDTFKADNSRSSCDRSLSTTSSPVPVAVAPCNLSAQATIPCSASSAVVRDDLKSMGKEGQAILRARAKVLEILQTENACTEWYRTKESDPAAVFRTLTFALDRQGDVYVRRTPESDGISLIRSPYVARVLQGEGIDATVTINRNGAFFFPMANVINDGFEGGPLSLRGSRPLQVGPYAGGTFRAQVLTLLHEFGHVIDLLPQDRGDYEGKSRQNTMEVFQACRAQLESKDAPHTLVASH